MFHCTQQVKPPLLGKAISLERLEKVIPSDPSLEWKTSDDWLIPLLSSLIPLRSSLPLSPSVFRIVHAFPLFLLFEHLAYMVWDAFVQLVSSLVRLYGIIGYQYLNVHYLPPTNSCRAFKCTLPTYGLDCHTCIWINMLVCRVTSICDTTLADNCYVDLSSTK